jgi:outer membrane protein assembly factor BamB
MISAGGRLYVTNQKGATVVFKPNPEKFELVATNDLNEPSNSTPAVSDGEIFLRTHKALYRIAE